MRGHVTASVCKWTLEALDAAMMQVISVLLQHQ